jgi:DNA-directed RNA polymerase subunit RPC12/RpoP
MIRFTCPTCNQVLQVSPDKAGTKGVCPKCNQKILVPIPIVQQNKTVLGKLEDLPQAITSDMLDLSPFEPPPFNYESSSFLSQLPDYKGWFIAWGVLTLFSACGGLAQGNILAFIQAPFGSAFLIIIVAVIYYSRSPCNGCGRRWVGSSWDHTTKSGRLDLRYKNNHLRCNACGHIKRY